MHLIQMASKISFKTEVTVYEEHTLFSLQEAAETHSSLCHGFAFVFIVKTRFADERLLNLTKLQIFTLM